MSLEKLKEKMKDVLPSGQTLDWVALGEFLSIWETMMPAYVKDHPESSVPRKFAHLRDIQKEVVGLRLSPLVGRKAFIETFTAEDVKHELGL